MGGAQSRGGRPAGCIQCHNDGDPFFTKMEVINIRELFKSVYPVLKELGAAPQVRDMGP